MEYKTCEEKVLADLAAAEEGIKTLEAAKKDMADRINYLATVVQITQQILKMRRTEDGTVAIVGSYVFDNKTEKGLIDLMTPLYGDDSLKEEALKEEAAKSTGEAEKK